MIKLPPDMDPLAAGLIGAIFPIIKDGQTGVVSAMAGFDLTFSQFRILNAVRVNGVNLNGVTVSSGVLNISAVWTEAP